MYSGRNRSWKVTNSHPYYSCHYIQTDQKWPSQYFLMKAFTFQNLSTQKDFLKESSYIACFLVRGSAQGR